MWIDTQGGGYSERKSWPHGSLNHVYGACVPGFLWPIILICLVLHPYLVLLRMQPTPVFLPGESQGRGSLVGCRLWGRTELDTTEVT